MPSTASPKFNHDKLLSSLKGKSAVLTEMLSQRHANADKWLKQTPINFVELKKKSAKLLAGASVAATMLLSPPPQTVVSTASEIRLKLKSAGFLSSQELENDMKDSLKRLAPMTPGHAAVANEKLISEIIWEKTGIKAYPQLEGQRLNDSYGWMGYEQHLKRYPGDTIENHQEQQAGIAPGLGAWGYFAHSQADMTDEDVEKEKYYFAVQTMYLPTWKSDLKHLVAWYKHRKMVAINPENGKAVVGVIADAGPAKFTGKQFGGSPEVMSHLNLTSGKKKGRVLLYFVDDPLGAIPLGPVKANYSQSQVSQI